MNNTPGHRTLERNPFAIAKEKAKEPPSFSTRDPHRKAIDLVQETAKAGLGILMAVGALIGMGGILFLAVGLLHSNGVAGLLGGWLTALNGG